MHNEKVAWQTIEYQYQEKSHEWFVGLAVIATALFIVAVLLKNFLFGIIILVGAFAIMLSAKRPPDEIEYEINRSGIVNHKTFYPYSFLDSFWIDNTNPSWQKLIVTSKKLLMPIIVIPLGEQDPDEIKNFLANYLPEKEQYEPLSHRLFEYFGF